MVGALGDIEGRGAGGWRGGAGDRWRWWKDVGCAVVGGGVEGKVWNGGSWGMMREECEAVQKYSNGFSRFQSPRDVSEVTVANRSNRTRAALVV